MASALWCLRASRHALGRRAYGSAGYTWVGEGAGLTTAVATHSADFAEALAEARDVLAPAPAHLPQRVHLAFALGAQVDLATELGGRKLEDAAGGTASSSSAAGSEGGEGGGEAGPRRRKGRVSRFSASSESARALLLPAGSPLWGGVGMGTLIGCTGGDYADGVSGRGLVLAALDVPASVVVEPFVCRTSALPALAAYPTRLREDASAFLLLASPTSGERDCVASLADRLSRAFPSSVVAGATAAAPRPVPSALPASTQLRPVPGRPLLFSSTIDVPTSAAVLGLALHGLHPSMRHELITRLLGAAFSEVEFDGFTGLFAGRAEMRRLFGVRGLRPGPVAALPAPDAALPGPVAPLPVFMLDRPIVPGEVLDVRIFEPRYRLMLKTFFTDKRPFAVSMLPHVAEAGVEEGTGPRAEGVPVTLTAIAGDSAPVPPQGASPPPPATWTRGGSPAARAGTVVRVKEVFEVGADGSAVVRLQGLSRVSWEGAAWRGPRSFGLVHARAGTWLRDEVVPPGGEGAARQAALLASIQAVWRGESEAHTQLRKIVRAVPDGPPAGGASVARSAEEESWSLAAMLPVPSLEKQGWLETGDTAARLSRQLEYLTRKLDDFTFRNSTKRGGEGKGEAPTPEATPV